MDTYEQLKRAEERHHRRMRVLGMLVVAIVVALGILLTRAIVRGAA